MFTQAMAAGTVAWAALGAATAVTSATLAMTQGTVWALGTTPGTAAQVTTLAIVVWTTCVVATIAVLDVLIAVAGKARAAATAMGNVTRAKAEARVTWVAWVTWVVAMVAMVVLMDKCSTVGVRPILSFEALMLSCPAHRPCFTRTFPLLLLPPSSCLPLPVMALATNT